MSKSSATEYRIEVSYLDLKRGQEQQFRREAQRAGFRVETTHNGCILAVMGLTCAQATTMRDGLAELGIHSSIGISASIGRARI